jgi:membrane protein implicated in regulation of membrane protease activity
MSWWVWILLGFLLLLLELLLSSSFYLLFFGCGALVVGLLAVLGWPGPLWAQGLLFSVLSVLSIALLRQRLVRNFKAPGNREIDSLVGETAIALQGIETHGFGKAELRGSSWNARNAGESSITAQQRCRVEKVDGLTLWVRGE